MGAPRQYHLIWSGRRFPGVFRLAAWSALLADPAATVRIHVVGPAPDGPAFASFDHVPGVSVEPLDPFALFLQLPEHLQRCIEVYNRLPAAAAAARSNLIRYAVLYLNGGVYLDFDTIVLRPLHDLSPAPCFVGAEAVWTGDAARVAGAWGTLLRPRHGAWVLSWMARRVDCKLAHGRLQTAERLASVTPRWSSLQANNAIIGAVPEAEFLDHVLRRAVHSSPTVRYALGPTLVDTVSRLVPHTVDVLPPEVLYQVPPGESYRFFEDRTLRLGADAAAIHYVGSNHRALLASLDVGDQRFANRSEVFWTLGRAMANRAAGLVAAPRLRPEVLLDPEAAWR